MRRREFITLLGGAAAAPVLWPRAAHADQPKRVGVLMNNVATNLYSQAYMTAWAQQLSKLGWIDGQNLHIEYRWNEGNAALARSYAAELVALAPDVILSSSTANLIALQRLSPAAPIVFVQVSDPVTQGFILSMARPGGNITGFTAYEFTIGAKWLDLLKQLVPAIDRVGVMSNPQTAPQSKFFMDSIEAAAPTFGVKSLRPRLTASPISRRHSQVCRASRTAVWSFQRIHSPVPIASSSSISRPAIGFRRFTRTSPTSGKAA